MSTVKQVTNNSEVDDRLSALLTNAGAIRAIASAVEGTIGPKGLDTMLVDQFGNVIITNDGVTILEEMDVTHPAARMMIKIAQAQEDKVGDGTTTATVMAGAMIGEGVNQAARGVPITRIIEGIKLAVAEAQKFIQSEGLALNSLTDPLLRKAALVAGRGREEIADLVLEACRILGSEKLKEPDFKLAECVKAVVGAKPEVFLGTMLQKKPLNRLDLAPIKDAKIMIFDDALEPEKIEEEALASEAGFNRYLELQQQFLHNLQKIKEIGADVILLDRGLSERAEEFLLDAGIMVVQRVMTGELHKTAEHTGAHLLKKTALNKSSAQLEAALGRAEAVYYDCKLEQIKIKGGAGKPEAVLTVGAATEEVLEESRRIAEDAASAVQAAWNGGIVSGGGAVELAASLELEKLKVKTKGMAVYGMDCVITALRRPFEQIVSNAGFNSLEALGDVLGAQTERQKYSLALNCDTGKLEDMLELGVVDPVPVKLHALQAAGEAAEAILRINTIIKKRHDPNAE